MKSREKFSRRERGVAAIELASIFVICFTLTFIFNRIADHIAYDGFDEVALYLTGGTKGGFGGKYNGRNNGID